MWHQTDDLRIDTLRPLLPPAILMEELPMPEQTSMGVANARKAAQAIIRGEDDRLLVVVGPCSIHDPEAGLEYAKRLKELKDTLQDDLAIVMRVYFEKPRTTVGWKGLINDPDLDESFSINHGLRVARQFLLDVAEVGLPAGSEFLDPITPQFFADLVTWGAIGARTTESQVHRELASGLSMPVGFKNGTGGNTQIAIDAIRSSAHPHRFLGVTKQSVAAIVSTVGNKDCHLILRGGKDGPNFQPDKVLPVLQFLLDAGLGPRLMVDCSHANSEKDHLKQVMVAEAIATQLENGQRGIIGVMMESFLQEGKQPIQERDSLTYGQSITDACLSFEQTIPVLERLASAVRSRRNHP
jgi:3-deoxy-7-phosphoheptulonate synthase